MYNFQYHRPQSLDDALALLADSDDGKLVAGGMTLLPTMKQRLAQPEDLIDLGAVPGLTGISAADGQVVIGAMTRHAEVEASDVVRAQIPALAELAGMIGDPQVRNRGTIGGSVANSDPAADYPAAVLACAASVVTNSRSIAADDYFLDLFETALDEDEVITEIRFNVPRRAAYQKFPNPASRYAMVGVMVAELVDGIRVAVTGAGACAFRVAAMEQALTARFAPESVANIAIPDDNLNSDIHASAEYRAHLVTIMAKRAVAAIA